MPREISLKQEAEIQYENACDISPQVERIRTNNTISVVVQQKNSLSISKGRLSPLKKPKYSEVYEDGTASALSSHHFKIPGGHTINSVSKKEIT